MTNKEIITLLNDIRNNNELSLNKQQKTAIDQAIKKVKQQRLMEALSLLKQLLTAAAHIYNKK